MASRPECKPVPAMASLHTWPGAPLLSDRRPPLLSLSSLRTLLQPQWRLPFLGLINTATKSHPRAFALAIPFPLPGVLFPRDAHGLSSVPSRLNLATLAKMSILPQHCMFLSCFVTFLLSLCVYCLFFSSDCKLDEGTGHVCHSNHSKRAFNDNKYVSNE